MREKLGPVLFEVLRHRMEEIVVEAYYTLARCSGNAVIAECGDHQEALLDADGNTVLATGGIVEWTYILEVAGRYLVEAYEENPGIYDGDQFIFNDSYIGCVHHPDVQLLLPIFWEGKRVAWIVTAGHVMDIGGMEPGGLTARAEEVFQEGLRIPGIKIVEGERVRKDVEDTLKGMTRQPELFMLDVRAKIAANNAASKRLKETIEKYGIDTILTLFREMQDYSERLVRAKLRKIPDGTWRAVNYIESLRKEEPYLKIEVTATKEGDELSLDFTGSSVQSRGSQNVAKPGMMGTVICSFLLTFAYDIPWSAGAWRPIKWIIPEGTFVNPRFPAALSMGCPAGAVDLTTGSSLIIMSQMLLSSKEFERDAYAGSGMGMQCNVLYGQDKAGELFITLNMEAVIAGMGALAYRDGEEACTYHWTAKSAVSNVEAMEEIFPVLYLFRKEAIDTGGPGKFRGGVANVIAIIPWDTDSIGVRSLSSGQEIRQTAGLAGGYPSNNSLHMVIRNSNILERFKQGDFPSDIEEIEGQREIIPLFSTYTLSSGDVVILFQTGGGGFGDPIDRDTELVVRDVKMGYVSLEAAKEIYGVIIEPETLEVNPKKTEQRRKAIIAERLKVGKK